MKNTKLIYLLATLFIYSSVFGQTASDTLATLGVKGLCGMCKNRIENAVAGDGVHFISWSSNAQQLTVRFDSKKTNLQKIARQVADVGHDNDLFSADSAVYQELPECCLYRDEPQGQHEDKIAADITGIVLREDDKGRFEPLENATITWMLSKRGTTTNAEGVFALNKAGKENKLVISYTGYATDTISWREGETIMVVLNREGSLDNVVISARQRSAYIRRSDAIRTQVMTSQELFKAACCNLSESFETNPVVDVSFTDAISGAKQIQLLGLSSAYTQLTVENMPGPRGLALPMGLSYIPGTWIESIQLNKGTGSVVNGYESIAGQINVELYQPDNADVLFANAYVNSMGKTDLNLNLATKVGRGWSTNLLLHNAFLFNKMDFNKDGFRDLPTGNLFALANKWQYRGDNGWNAQVGFKLLTDDKVGGELAYDDEKHKGTTTYYGLGFNTNRLEGFAKIGYVFPEQKYRSIGLQLSGFKHDNKSYFGLTNYNALQNNLYANLIYQNIIGNTAHKFRTGLSVISDTYDEEFGNNSFERSETVSGGFFEYTYDNAKNFSAVVGLRADYNNIYGWFGTPRLHVRYNPFSKTTLRASVGRGQRTTNIIADNAGPLVSSRIWQIPAAQAGKAYGLNQEIAWNSGVSIDQQMKLFGRDASVGIDFFRTSFQEQVVVNMEDPDKVVFSNLDGKSYANSFQAELNMIPVNNLALRLAYRLFDVKTTYDGVLLEKPFVARHRGFANLAYEVKGWKFDYTINYNSSKRIPNTTSNLPAFQLAERSPDFVLMNAQISKSFGKLRPLDVYVGGENLSNFLQQNAIIDPSNPFGENFDASMIWGPVTGRMFYAGVRFRLP